MTDSIKIPKLKYPEQVKPQQIYSERPKPKKVYSYFFKRFIELSPHKYDVVNPKFSKSFIKYIEDKKEDNTHMYFKGN